MGMPFSQGNISRRLHEGCFAVQDSIDLHGMTLGEAEEALHRFFSEAIRKKTILHQGNTRERTQVPQRSGAQRSTGQMAPQFLQKMGSCIRHCERLRWRIGRDLYCTQIKITGPPSATPGWCLTFPQSSFSITGQGLWK